MAPSRHDWKIVDWDVKPQHNQQILAAFANLYFRNNFTIKLFTSMCVKGYTMMCLKFGSDCSLRINKFYVVEKC